MQTTIRLAVALIAAAAFTAAWAGDNGCEAKDMPCATVVAQDAKAEDSTSVGAGAGEPSGESSTSDIDLDRLHHEVWESGD
jgi:hypothetical protein